MTTMMRSCYIWKHNSSIIGMSMGGFGACAHTWVHMSPFVLGAWRVVLLRWTQWTIYINFVAYAPQQIITTDEAGAARFWTCKKSYSDYQKKRIVSFVLRYATNCFDNWHVCTTTLVWWLSAPDLFGICPRWPAWLWLLCLAPPLLYSFRFSVIGHLLLLNISYSRKVVFISLFKLHIVIWKKNCSSNFSASKRPDIWPFREGKKSTQKLSSVMKWSTIWDWIRVCQKLWMTTLVEVAF